MQSPILKEEQERPSKGSHLFLVGKNPALKRSVAIIDDDEAIVFYLSEYFSRFGVNTKGFSSSESALEHFRAFHNAHWNLEGSPYDLVMVDVYLPKMNGLMFMKEITSLFPSIPVALITAYATIPDAVAAIKNSAVDYLQKPFSAESLQKLSRSYL